MHKFKKGDFVKCVDGRGCILTTGEVYQVLGTACPNPGDLRVKVIDNHNIGHYANRFVPYKLSNEERIQKRKKELSITYG